MTSWRFWLATIILSLCTTAAFLPGAQCCDFCSQQRGPTLVGDFSLASLVLFGHMENPRSNANGDYLTDFVIEQVVKDNPVVKDKKVITLRRRVPETKSKFLLFCDVLKGGVIDDYRGVEVTPNSDMVKYLHGAVDLKDVSPGKRLRYCFDFLNDADFEIAIDAYREFAKADYKDYMTMAKTLPPDVIAKWLTDPKTPAFRHGLYASLLGHCGTSQHAKLLRSMIEDSLKRKTSDIDGLLAGYLMIQPKEAWHFLQDILRDQKNEFGTRYACLRTISFLWDQRPDLIDRKELTAGLTLVLAQSEMADFGVDYLRKYKCWDTTDQVLDLWGKKNFEIPIIKRSILRFALRSPEARAATFVQQQRQRDPEWVKDIDELLKQERQ